MLRDLSILFLCYFVGAIPTGLLVSRLLGGIDIREHGSKNIGATNVWRVLGWKLGLTTFLIDVAKAAAVLLFVKFHIELVSPGPIPHLSVFGGVAVLLGNFFNVFLKFKGGKGVATSLGVFLALSPIAILIAFAVFLLVFAISRYVSLGSISASITAPIMTYVFYDDHALLIFVIVAAILVLIKHRANIKRLLNGTESKFVKKKKPAPAELSR